MFYGLMASQNSQNKPVLLGIISQFGGHQAHPDPDDRPEFNRPEL